MPESRIACILTLCFLSLSMCGPQTSAQEIKSVVTGYGTTGYDTQIEDSLQHNFSASFTPVGLFKTGEDFLFEGELDIELDGTSTRTTLEHAQIHYLGLERVQVTAGKFHVPFGLWKHQFWINKMPSPPLLYGHAHGGVAHEALLPIFLDVGVKGMGKVSIGSWGMLGAALWASQGPAQPAEAHDDTHDGDGGHGHEVESSDIPQVAYGVNYADNNRNKMVGGRLRLMSARNFMIAVAGFSAKYDADDRLRISGANVSIKWQPGLYDLRGEGILLQQDVHHHSEVESVRRGGYYVQGTRRVGAYEPVVRWSHLPVSEGLHGHAQARKRQVAVGLNYWFSPSVPVKIAYEWGLDGSDSVRVQWAFGF